MDWETVRAELQKPLNPSAVKPPAPGKYGNYVDSYHVITEANRIFGEDGWSYSITSLDQVCRVECLDKKGNPQVRVGWKATVRVEAGGTFKEGSAVGSGYASPDNEADAHESAVKEAETDALKRALRTYGNTFGLALYDKEQRNVREDESVILERKMLGHLLTDNHAKFNSVVSDPRFQADLTRLSQMDQEAGNRVAAKISEQEQRFGKEAA